MDGARVINCYRSSPEHTWLPAPSKFITIFPSYQLLCVLEWGLLVPREEGSNCYQSFLLYRMVTVLSNCPSG
jgi:hypothetical protein